ncbi:MAG TPA: hypothetical protein VES88_15175 [Gemmatimonadaceae bacterium]|nr:hypothetical protein [Gemmatimonadaceae bacterium]
MPLHAWDRLGLRAACVHHQLMSDFKKLKVWQKAQTLALDTSALRIKLSHLI